MTTLFTGFVNTDSQSDDITTLFVKPSHYNVEVYGDLRSDKPRPFSTIRGIVFLGIRYNDQVAACSCKDLEPLKYGDELYTRCHDHRIQLIGTLRREIGKKATK